MHLTHLVFTLATRLGQLARATAARSALLRSERGAVSVEYMMVFGCVTIGMTAALVKLGPALLTAWGTTQAVLLTSKP